MDLVGQFRSAMSQARPWDSIIDFATHPSFTGLRLYPRQQTLLKLIYLETENMTAYDMDVIEEWRQGFKDPRTPAGVQEDIWERIEFLKANGYTHFPHIQAILGRRASKGMIGGVLAAERLGYMVSLDNPQEHYGIAEGKEMFLHVVATNQEQAKKFLFADVRQAVEQNPWLTSRLSVSKEYRLSLRTPADLRRIAEMTTQGLPIDREIASIQAVAMSSNSSSGRGGSAFANLYDEFAHLVNGTGGPRTSDEVYAAYHPALDQLGRDALTYIPSSPLCLVPETRVLTEELDWVPVGDLQVGDRLIGFDEYGPGGKGNTRTYQPATVVETGRIVAETYTIKVGDKEITCTGEHPWLIRKRETTQYVRGSRANLYSPYDNPSQRISWVRTRDLLPGDKIISIGGTWEPDRTFEGGYLAGMIDGEGWNNQSYVAFCQNYGDVMDHTQEILRRKSIEFKIHPWGRGGGADILLTGGYRTAMKFHGTFKNVRVSKKFVQSLYGAKAYNNMHSGTTFEVVESVTPVGMNEVVTLETSTKTLIAEGLFSHNTKVGKFYELYTNGRVLMPEYLEKERAGRAKVYDQDDLADELEDFEQEVYADPELLVVQLPSWELYKDWEDGKKLVGVPFKRAIQYEPLMNGRIENERMVRLEKRDPEKFKVERRAQFAEVVGAYLDPEKVDDMFRPFRLKEGEPLRVLERQEAGRVGIMYHGHVDPSKSNANFAIAIGHLERSEIPDEHGDRWNHVVFDFLHVYQPSQFDNHTVDYVQIEKDLQGLLGKYRSLQVFSFDQWNSVGFIHKLRQTVKKLGTATTVKEVTFNHSRNQKVAEQFKTALNMGWVHAYKDTFFDDGEGSLLEQELKFLTEKNGKVEKQNIGPVTTKDLADTVMEVTVSLLESQLGRADNLDTTIAVGAPGGYPTNSLLNPSASSLPTGGGGVRDRLGGLRAGGLGGGGLRSRGRRL